MLKGATIKKSIAQVTKAVETMVDIKFSYETDDEVGAFVIFQKARINFEDNKEYILHSAKILEQKICYQQQTIQPYL